jgi:CheY-like chemotaxis protein
MTPTLQIADADRDICHLYKTFFSRHGWQVRTSGGGVECLAQLRQGAPHLLILDLDLPWGGVEGVLAVMRDDPRLARVPVILTSAGVPPETVAGLIAPPVVRALEKPNSLATLLGMALTEWQNGGPGWKVEGGRPGTPARCS